MSEKSKVSAGGLNLEACLEKTVTLVVRDIGPFVDCNIGFADEKSRTVSGRLVGIEPEIGLWLEPENSAGSGWRVLVLWRDILVLMQADSTGLPTLSRLPEKPIGFRSRGE